MSVLFPEDNPYEVLRWEKEEPVSAVFLRVQKSQYVRYVSWEISKGEGEGRFNIRVLDGEMDVPFEKGDALVFTRHYVVKFPGKIDGYGNPAEVAIYSLRKEVPSEYGGL